MKISLLEKYNNTGISDDDYIEQIMDMNGMDSNKVHPGCFIIVSYKVER